MKNIENFKRITDLPITGLFKVEDIIEFDGPILSRFKDSSNNDYLFYWVDYDSNCNRWLVFKISDDQLSDYMSHIKSLKQIIDMIMNEVCFIADIDANANYENIFSLHIHELPNEYLPDEKSFYFTN